MVAARILDLILAKKSARASGLATLALFACGRVVSGSRKDATFECVLVPATDIVLRWFIKRCGLESSGISNGGLFLSTLGSHSRALNSAPSFVFVSKNVGILVRGASNRGLTWFFGEILSTPVFALNRSMVIRLHEIEG